LQRLLDHAGRFIDMLTDRDICMAAYTQDMTLSMANVESAMASTVVSCNPQDELEDAQKLMCRHRVRRLPVVDADGKIVGLLSLSDIAREAERERREGGRRQVRATNVAATLGGICEQPAHVNAHVAFGPEAGEREFPPTPALKRGHLHKPHGRPGQ
jgi:CBS-domain-containing membrane protein